MFLVEKWNKFISESDPFATPRTNEEIEQIIRKLPKEKILQLQNIINNKNNEYREKFSSWLTLYHGSSKQVVDKIKKTGFEKTIGQRSGFLGSTRDVQNHFCFFSDNKTSAISFAQNRSKYDSDAGVVEVRAKFENILDMTHWGIHIPMELRKIMIASYNKHYGGESKRPSKAMYWWLLDQPEIVEKISETYDCVVFFEDKQTMKTIGAEALSKTYAVFDLSKIVIPNLPISTYQDVWEKTDLQTIYKHDN